MKQINLTGPIMDKVAGYEKERVGRWRIRYTVILSALVFLLAGFSVYTISQIVSENTFDLLTLFTQDREVLSLFWRDTIISLWEEMPQLEIISGFVVLLVLLGIIFATRRIRQVNKRKLEEIKELQNQRKKS
jgi:hypothetical protein